MGRIRVSKLAQRDIGEIGRYTQKAHGPTQRRKYLASLYERFEFLQDMPQIAGERHEFTPPVRIFRHNHHYIVYIADVSGILIVRVLHTSMDINTLLTAES